MAECFMMQTQRSGGGNSALPRRIMVRRTAAMGDVIASTVVADKLVEAGFSVGYQTHGKFQALLRRHRHIETIESPVTGAVVNLDNAYEQHPNRRKLHFCEMFMERANRQLIQQGIDLGPVENCRPRLLPSLTGRLALRQHLEQFPAPWIFICPGSEYYACRQVPDGIWEQFRPLVAGTCFWIGLHPAPKGYIDLNCRELTMLADYLSLGDLLVTVDTGPMHLANALGTRCLVIGQASSPELHLSDQSDFETFWPDGLDCLNCQENACPINRWKPPCQNIDPARIAKRANEMLSLGISAVIPIFNPSAEVLNRCLECVLPQVGEVIITRERNGLIPGGTIIRPKIRHVVKDARSIGFGRNVNFGFRHTSGDYVLVLNDDVYLDPGAVRQMINILRIDPRIGVVGMLTRYPDGTIYHAGKVRPLGGGVGFPHIDLRKRQHRIQVPTEMENTNGAALLFRRQAFYDVDGFDERFLFYCEDDDICMKLRLKGWKVWFTPLATGIHDEHHETKNLAGAREIMHQSNLKFGQKWRDYFTHNANTQGLGNFDYLKK